MDWMSLGKKIPAFAKKYRYAILVLLLGLALMLIPGKKQVNDTQEPPQTTSLVSEKSISEQMEAILSQIDGAGQVRVLLSVASGEEILYQVDQDGEDRTSTVIVTNGDRSEAGLIRQTNPPKYLGAIILCQGAEKAGIKLAIVEAVSRLTGLGADRISVLKMK